MSDDIVTRLGTPEDSVRELLSGCICNFIGDGNCRLCRGAEQIERLQVERDMWKKTSTKLVGMMLPYSLLMNETERQELKIILEEATR